MILFCWLISDQNDFLDFLEHCVFIHIWYLNQVYIIIKKIIKCKIGAGVIQMFYYIIRPIQSHEFSEWCHCVSLKAGSGAGCWGQTHVHGEDAAWDELAVLPDGEVPRLNPHQVIEGKLQDQTSLCTHLHSHEETTR